MANMTAEICIVGSGFSGAVIARQLAQAGFRCEVFESRPHVAGNCHMYRDHETGIMLHAYGPHIFHTSNSFVWNYVRAFDEMMPFTNRVKAVSKGRIFSLPINLHTINQFFDKVMSPEEAKEFLSAVADRSIADPLNFEEQAMRFVGRDLYEAFFKGYTRKQWGIEPRRIPASVLKRLPIRFNYNDNYYDSLFQAIPRNGYTFIVERMLDDKNIRVHLNTPMQRADTKDYKHTFYTGPIDAWFGHSEGRLSYRTLDFIAERHPGDFQGNPVINYCDESVPWTRISEHKHFAPWESHDSTIIFKEHSRDCGLADIPYYPVRLADDQNRLALYNKLVSDERNVTFVGRLGTYRYLDMDVTIEEALKISAEFIRK
jgi:UDP-galactopyranose mutase